jgi:branched-chain amino acid transport system substrate-binding protein
LAADREIIEKGTLMSVGRAVRFWQHACAIAVLGLTNVLAAQAQDEIKIGEINSYSAFPAFAGPYRNGWQLATEEINAAGGVLGKKLVVISKDDAGRPADAITAASKLVFVEKVALLAGTAFSHVGLAVADFAQQHKVYFFASEPVSDALTLSKGNHYSFRLRASTYMQTAMLVEEAAKLPARRWATIAPNFEYGQSAVAAFKRLLSAKRPDIVWVGEQWPALGKLDAGAAAQAVVNAKPDALFNVLFGADLEKFVREGNTRGIFKNLSVVGFLLGDPEYLDPLGSEAPEGWIVSGYPWYSIDTPEHDRFLAAYGTRFRESPRMASVVGYQMIQTLAAIIRRAGSTDTEKLVQASKGITFGTPFGPASIRANDHQATMGTFIGRTALKDGKGVMVDWHYADGARFLPPEDYVKQSRPPE